MGQTTIGSVWAATRAWIEQPFRSTMSLGGWALFVLMLMVITIGWGRVLDHVGE